MLFGRFISKWVAFFAINPVGRSCDTVSLFQDEKMIASVDRDVKKSIQQWQPDQKSEQFVQEVVITSINKRNCKCKFYLYDDYLEDPEDISVFSAEIKDDAFNTPGSAYIDSLDEATPIKVKIVKKDTQGLKPTFEIIGLADNQ